jgi:NhaA family Na+:H+ antiporter
MRSSTIRIIQDFSIPLLAGVAVALVWANIDLGVYERVWHWSPLGEHSRYSLHFVVNDVFMALFFGIAAAEIVEACLPGGALNPPLKALNPLMGTFGGVVGPACVYLAVVFVAGESDLARGWGIPTATDIAVAWLVARMVFGRGHPAVAFLLLLAIADDAIGLVIIAIFYPDPAHPVQPLYLLVVAGAMAMAFVIRRAQVQSYWAYLLGPGVVSWVGLLYGGLHPALALVAIVPFMPNMGEDAGLFEEEEEEATDTLNRFEHAFKLPVDVGLFFFGLANAGVAVSSAGTVTVAVLGALLLGKTGGITLFSLIARRLGAPLPSGMSVRELVVAGMVAGIGLTVALFVAGVAFVQPELRASAKLGALLSMMIAPIAIAVARMVGVRPRSKKI